MVSMVYLLSFITITALNFKPLRCLAKNLSQRGFTLTFMLVPYVVLLVGEKGQDLTRN